MANEKHHLHVLINGEVFNDFEHARIDENFRKTNQVIEGLMLLFTYDLSIRKRVTQEVGRIATEEGVKKLLADRERFGVVASEEL